MSASTHAPVFDSLDGFPAIEKWASAAPPSTLQAEHVVDAFAQALFPSHSQAPELKAPCRVLVQSFFADICPRDALCQMYDDALEGQRKFVVLVASAATAGQWRWPRFAHVHQWPDCGLTSAVKSAHPYVNGDRTTLSEIVYWLASVPPEILYAALNAVRLDETLVPIGLLEMLYRKTPNKFLLRRWVHHHSEWAFATRLVPPTVSSLMMDLWYETIEWPAAVKTLATMLEQNHCCSRLTAKTLEAFAPFMPASEHLVLKWKGATFDKLRQGDEIMTLTMTPLPVNDGRQHGLRFGPPEWSKFTKELYQALKQSDADTFPRFVTKYLPLCDGDKNMETALAWFFHESDVAPEVTQLRYRELILILTGPFNMVYNNQYAASKAFYQRCCAHLERSDFVSSDWDSLLTENERQALIPLKWKCHGPEASGSIAYTALLQAAVQRQQDDCFLDVASKRAAIDELTGGPNGQSWLDDVYAALDRDQADSDRRKRKRDEFESY